MTHRSVQRCEKSLVTGGQRTRGGVELGWNSGGIRSRDGQGLGLWDFDR